MSAPVSPDRFREALAHWPSGVTIVAVRDDARVYALTATSFMSLSVDPPLVVVSLGPNASALPFLSEGASFGLSILAAHQRRLASVYADGFPVGPSPFHADGVPLVEEALVGLSCTVAGVVVVADQRLVVGRVEETRLSAERGALLHFRRRYGSAPGT